MQIKLKLCGELQILLDLCLGECVWSVDEVAHKLIPNLFFINTDCIMWRMFWWMWTDAGLRGGARALNLSRRFTKNTPLVSFSSQYLPVKLIRVAIVSRPSLVVVTMTRQSERGDEGAEVPTSFVYYCTTTSTGMSIASPSPTLKLCGIVSLSSCHVDVVQMSFLHRPEWRRGDGLHQTMGH